MRQSDRKCVKKLLSEADRLDLKKHISKVWEELPDDEQNHENCFQELINLFPEKKIVINNILLEDEWGETEY